jgi:outer membrane protein assembly factor BamB
MATGFIGLWLTVALAVPATLPGKTQEGAPGAEGDLEASFVHPTLVDASAQAIFGLKWRRPIVRTGMLRTVNVSFGRPALSLRAGVAIVGSGEGDVQALALKDGSLRWSYHHGAPFETAATLVQVPAAASGQEPTELALLGARDGVLLAFEPSTGAIVWRADIAGDMRAPAVRVGDRLVLATAMNRVQVLDVATGKALWNAGRPPPTGLTITGHARPLVEGDAVYASFSDGYVEAYALADGARRWSRPLSLRGGDFVDADADPILQDGRLFVASYSDGIYALDPANGQTLWTRSAAAVRTLALAGDKLFAGSGNGWVFAVATKDGHLLQRVKLAKGFVTRMEARDGLVVLGGGDSGLVVLDARSGRPLQASGYKTRMDGDPAWEKNEVAVLSAPGVLYSFERSSHRPLQ